MLGTLQITDKIVYMSCRPGGHGASWSACGKPRDRTVLFKNTHTHARARARTHTHLFQDALRFPQNTHKLRHYFIIALGLKLCGTVDVSANCTCKRASCTTPSTHYTTVSKCDAMTLYRLRSTRPCIFASHPYHS